MSRPIASIRAAGAVDRDRPTSDLREPVLWVVLLVAFTLLAAQFPRTGDDWAWGSSIGLERWDDGFGGYNGRYVGNVAVLLLTRAGLLTPLVVGATLVATIALLLDVVRMRTRTGYLVATTLVLLMPLALWREGVVWLSGFSNYALGTAAMLAFLASTRRQWEEPSRRTSPWRIVAVVVAGLCGALLIEHITLYLVVASVVAVVVLRRRHGAFSPTSLAWASSCLVGAATMFSNSAYRRAAGSTDSYQQIGGTDGGGPVRQLTVTISRLTVVDNLYLVLALTALVMLLVVVRSATWRSTRSLVVGGTAVSVVALTWALRQLLPNVAEGSLLWYLNGLVAALLLIAVVGTAWWYVADPRRRAWLLVLSGSVVVLVAPLAVVQPIGPRTFFPTYVLLVGVAMLLLQEVADRPLPALDLVAAAVAAAVLVTQVAMYGAISRAADQRVVQAREAAAAGATQVRLRPLPFVGAVHVPDPRGELWQERYKIYYGLPSDLRIRMRP